MYTRSDAMALCSESWNTTKSLGRCRLHTEEHGLPTTLAAWHKTAGATQIPAVMSSGKQASNDINALRNCAYKALTLSPVSLVLMFLGGWDQPCQPPNDPLPIPVPTDEDLHDSQKKHLEGLEDGLRYFVVTPAEAKASFPSQPSQLGLTKWPSKENSRLLSKFVYIYVFSFITWFMGVCTLYTVA